MPQKEAISPLLPAGRYHQQLQRGESEPCPRKHVLKACRYIQMIRRSEFLRFASAAKRSLSGAKLVSCPNSDGGLSFLVQLRQLIHGLAIHEKLCDLYACTYHL